MSGPAPHGLPPQLASVLVRCQFCTYHGGPGAPPPLMPGYQACMQSERAPGLMVAIHRPNPESAFAVPIHTAVQFSCSLWVPDHDRIVAAQNAHGDSLLMLDAAPVRLEPPETIPPAEETPHG